MFLPPVFECSYLCTPRPRRSGRPCTGGRSMSPPVAGPQQRPSVAASPRSRRSTAGGICVNQVNAAYLQPTVLLLIGVEIDYQCSVV